MGSHRDPHKLAPSQPDNDQNVELDKADGGYHEQIHGCDMRHMIAQKRAIDVERYALLCSTLTRLAQRIALGQKIEAV
jgi:hypothetical protein